MRLRPVREAVPEEAIYIDVDDDGEPDLVTPGGTPPPTPVRRWTPSGRHPALPPPGEVGPLPGQPPGVVLTAHGPDEHMAPTPTPEAPPTVPARRLREDRRPIFSPWLLTKESRRNMARWWAGRQGYRGAFHGVRLPIYTGRITYRAPRGLLRCVVFLVKWSLDTRADALEQALADGVKQDSQEFRALREDRAFRVKSRCITVGVITLLLAVSLAWFLAWSSPWWAEAVAWLLVTAAVAGLAVAGSDRSKPLVGPAMLVTARFREVTDVVLMRALRAAGLAGTAAKFDREGKEVAEDTRATLALPIARSQNGLGTLCVVDLPPGKTAGDASAAVESIASGLDVTAEQVVIEPVKGRIRRASIYIADEDPFSLPPRRSPLARLPKTSIWDENPIAMTPAGREVKARLIFNSVLIGAVPRAGKSFSAKLLATPAMLDPHTDVHVFDFGGGRDWLPARDLAVDYVSGDEEDELAAALASLERLRGEIRARLAEFRTLSGKELPEDKLTAELAASGMHPKLVVTDEIQNLLRSPNKELRKLGLELLTWFVKTAPKAGVVTEVITQRPAADVISADLRDLITLRLALRTKSPQGSDAILGAYLSAQGWRTDRFLETHRGAAVIGGISTGQGGDLQFARMDLLMPAEFEEVCRVGRARRDEAGTLKGQAAGDVEDVIITVTVLDDVWTAWPGEEPKVQAHELLGRLRQLFPRRYPERATETSLSRELSRHKIPSSQVWANGSNRQGYQRADVIRARAALAAADDDQDLALGDGS